MERNTNIAILKQAYKTARDRAVRSNKALELEYLIVKDGKVFKVLPNGDEQFLKNAEFDSSDTEMKQFVLPKD